MQLAAKKCCLPGSRSVIFFCSVSPSFLGVFLCCFVCVLVLLWFLVVLFGFVVFLWCFGFVFGWVCLVLFWKTPGFLLSILQYVGIANQRQNILMTVRASSVHGSKKKVLGL